MNDEITRVTKIVTVGSNTFFIHRNKIALIMTWHIVCPVSKFWKTLPVCDNQHFFAESHVKNVSTGSVTVTDCEIA